MLTFKYVDTFEKDMVNFIEFEFKEFPWLFEEKKWKTISESIEANEAFALIPDHFC